MKLKRCYVPTFNYYSNARWQITLAMQQLLYCSLPLSICSPYIMNSSQMTLTVLPILFLVDNVALKLSRYGDWNRLLKDL